MDHSSLISCLANVSITDPLSICNANYHQIVNEYDNRYDKCANDIGHAWHSGLSNTLMCNVNLFFSKAIH